MARPPSRADLALARALDAIGYMRSYGLSLRKAAREAGTTPATVKKYAPRALRRLEGGAYAATRSDDYLRRIYFLTERGKIPIIVRDSRTASRIAKYWSAVDYYLKTGRDDRLLAFRGETLRSKRRVYRFVTDPRMLSRLGHAGEVTFEDLYVLRS